MKMLIIGIDGLGWENIETLNLKRLKARLENGTAGSPHVENINSRGWCEIYSGEDCYKTGAFFQVPVKSGKRIIPSQSTGAPRVSEHVGQDAMLWNRLNAMGHSVGIFTVPTITKPIEINGFSVAGTGGGSFGGSLGPSSVSPPDLFQYRKAAGADLGFRYGYGAFLPNNLEELELGANAHLALYFYELRASFAACPVDVAWVGTRFITELGYKFTGLLTSEPKNEHAAALKTLVLSLADAFDEMLDTFIEEQKIQELFIVSDHGLGNFTHRINLNHALTELGLLEIDRRRSLIRRGKHRLRMARARRPMNSEIGASYDFAKSKAFSIGYTNLLYVNDARFFGPEMTDSARSDLAAHIAKQMNDLCKTESGMANVTFEPTNLAAYTHAHEDARLPQPDIRAYFPNGLANLGLRPMISQKNICDFGPEHFSKGVPGEYSGIKTDDTLTAYVGSHADVVKQDRLTDLYGSILAVAERLS